MNTIITNVNELKVGDVILIKSKPELWSSRLNENSPLRGKLDFPIIITIKKIRHINIFDYYSMTCGNYGWVLESIIEAGCKKIIEDIPLNKLIEEYRRLL